MKKLVFLFIVVMLSTTAFGQYYIELQRNDPGYVQVNHNIYHNDNQWIVGGYILGRYGYTMFKSVDDEYLYT